MPANKQNVAVFYDTYEPYEVHPDRKLLGCIDRDDAQTLIDTLKDAAIEHKIRCVSNVSIDYTQHLTIYGPAADVAPNYYPAIGISSILQRGDSWCTNTKHKYLDTAEKNCIKNLRAGKCTCPVMRKVGEILYPNLYPQKTK